MADTISPEQRSAVMRQVKSKDTKPEMRIRSLLHKRGFRFRLHRRDLPGVPDL
ncbi:MAG: vsr, partial [Capsulimonas sp.]|nr:vsr [Capsulimonas sp.]